jgi:signal peptidase I
MEVLKRIYSTIIDVMQTFLMAASIFLVIYIFIMRPFQVSGESMFPTFKNKEYILTNRIGLRFDSPRKGDVIVFKAPNDSDKDFIKRVIAEPGDSVFVKDGYVYVNGLQLDESAYLASDVRTYGGSFLKEDQPVTVPEGNYIVMGDNRPYSSDSREWGLLGEEDIVGLSFFVYWPFNNMRMVENPFPESP